ncbi:MAG: nicotianamine synthase family protein [Acidimicrobiales bacterium]
MRVVLILDPHDHEPSRMEVVAALLDETLGFRGSEASIYHVVASRLPELAGWEALAPGPETDAALSRLVDLVTTTFHPKDDRGRFSHWDVVRSACRLIEADAQLLERASTVRRAAGIAESLMEIHHARLLLTDTELPRSEVPLETLRWMLRPFPYLGNYELLVNAELAGLQSTHGAARLAFCGAGALPLSAILWHLTTDCQVTLIEIDPYVGRLAEQVLDRLGQHGVIKQGAFSIEISDAADLDPTRFDQVAIASLVPSRAATSLARTLAKLGTDGPVLVARSAVGLTALLAYEPIDLQAITDTGLRHVGTVAPVNHVSDEPDLTDLAIEPTSRLLHTAPSTVLNTSEYFMVDMTSTPAPLAHQSGIPAT